MIFFNLSEYKDIRYHDFHILIPGRSHRFKDVPDPMLIEDFLRKHADLIHQNLYRWYYSFYISFAYLITIWLLKNWMKKREPFRMRSLLITWNILLSIFSLIGSYRVLPEFISVLYDHGFLYSISRSSYYFVSYFSTKIFFCFFFFCNFINIIDIFPQSNWLQKKFFFLFISLFSITFSRCGDDAVMVKIVWGRRKIFNSLTDFFLFVCLFFTTK